MLSHYIITLCSLLVILQISSCRHKYSFATNNVPQSIVIGTSDGEIQRCEFDNINKCKKLHRLRGPILSLAISGEFIYAGLNKAMYRCYLHREEKCTEFHKLNSVINALTVSGEHVFVGTDEGIIHRCGLRKSENCTVFYEALSKITALTTFNSFLYVGSEKALLSCSVDETNTCTELIHATSRINALNYDAKYIYAGLTDGGVMRCELNSDNCTTLCTAHAAIKALDIFGDYLQTALSSGDIWRYHLGNNESLTYNKTNGLVLSLTSTYSLGKIQHHYAGENTNCTWQFSVCPPYVNYYDVESRYSLQLHVEDGLMYNSRGELFDTSEADRGHTGRRAIFVMDPVGRIYASNQHPIMLLHHSSLLAGNPVAAAGELHVIQGVIKSASSCSGHYRQPVRSIKQITSALRRQGYHKKFEILNCWSESLMIDLYYRKLGLYYETKCGKNYVRRTTEWEEEGFLNYGGQ